MPPPSDIVKVAIEWPGANAQLLEIDQVMLLCDSQSCKEGQVHGGGCVQAPEATGFLRKGSDRKAAPWAWASPGR